MITLSRKCPSADCPGHDVCPLCGSDYCPDCQGCGCQPNLCAWTLHEPGCREIYGEASTEPGVARQLAAVCEEHDWRGPERASSSQARADLERHISDVHEGAAA